MLYFSCPYWSNTSVPAPYTVNRDCVPIPRGLGSTPQTDFSSEPKMLARLMYSQIVSRNRKPSGPMRTLGRTDTTSV